MNYSVNAENTRLIIYDVHGKIVKQESLNRAQENLELQLNDLAAGIYQCIITSGYDIKAKEKLILIK